MEKTLYVAICIAVFVSLGYFAYVMIRNEERGFRAEQDVRKARIARQDELLDLQTDSVIEVCRREYKVMHRLSIWTDVFYPGCLYKLRGSGGDDGWLEVRFLSWSEFTVRMMTKFTASHVPSVSDGRWGDVIDVAGREFTLSHVDTLSCACSDGAIESKNGDVRIGIYRASSALEDRPNELCCISFEGACSAWTVSNLKLR